MAFDVVMKTASLVAAAANEPPIEGEHFESNCKGQKNGNKEGEDGGRGYDTLRKKREGALTIMVDEFKVFDRTGNVVDHSHMTLSGSGSSRIQTTLTNITSQGNVSAKSGQGKGSVVGGAHGLSIQMRNSNSLHKKSCK